jgi:hypothetical protein
MAAPPTRGRRIHAGDVIARTFATLRRSGPAIGAITGLGALASTVLLFVLRVVGLEAVMSGSEPGNLIGLFITSAVGILLSGWTHASVVHVVLASTKTRVPSVGAALSFGTGRMFPVAGALFLSSLAVGFGTMLCFIPGLIALAQYATAGTVATAEPVGSSTALARSSELGRDQRLIILASIFAMTPVPVVIYSVAVLLQSVVLEAPGFSLAALMSLTRQETPSAMALMLAAQATMNAISMTFSAVLYRRLTRKRRDARSIARVFE